MKLVLPRKIFVRKPYTEFMKTQYCFVTGTA